MKDELPDLTPYLNKKGGNSQGRGEENPAGKTDISQKLSALVKKPGNTGTHPSVQAALDAASAQEAAKAEPTNENRQTADQVSQDAPAEATVAPQAGLEASEPVAEVTGQATREATPDATPESTRESLIGLVKRPTPAPAADNQAGEQREGAGSNGQDPSPPKASPAIGTTSRWGDLDAIGAQSWPKSTDEQAGALPASDNAAASDSTVSRASGDSPPAVPRSDDNYASSPSREMARPGQPLDKLKTPQSKPMSTLSSSTAPPLLKMPPKEPGRPAQPYSYKPGVEPGREVMAPRGPSQAPVNRAPQPVAAPKPAMPQPPANAMTNSFAPTDRSAPSPNMPQSSPSPSASRPEPQGQPQSQLQSQPQSQSQPQPQPRPSSPRVESDAEKLARAFMEEARALQDSPREADLPTETLSSGGQFGGESLLTGQSRFGDYQPPSTSLNDPNEPAGLEATASYLAEEAAQEPVTAEPKPGTHGPREAGPKASLSSLFDSGVLNSRSEIESGKKPIGFGNLLAGAPPPQDEDKHTTFSDLMVPTGEHDILLAPDRREPSDTSAFDEITAQVNADQESVLKSLSGESLSQSQADSASMRMTDKSQAPAFSSLFSSEIVTSGSDFSDRDSASSSTGSSFGDTTVGTGGDADSDLLEPSTNAVEDESRSANPKSLAISKLIEAVNQGESSEYSSNYSSEFSPGTTGDTKKDLFSSDIVSASNVPEVSEPQGADYTPDIGALSPSALEALAAFVPKVGEEQHETKGLLAKLKAKDAAAKAAKKAEAAQGQGTSTAKPESKTTGQTGAQAESQEDSTPLSTPAKSSLASLLGDSQPVEDVRAKAPEPAAQPEPEDQSSGNSLGDAISDALDKLLSEDADSGYAEGVASGTTGEAWTAEPSGKSDETAGMKAPYNEADSANQPSGLSKLLDDDPDRFDRPINSNMRKAENVLEEAITASAAEPGVSQMPPQETHPLALTNSKVDALSRLLEVASKAPQKPPEETAAPSDSSNRLAEMINRSADKARPQEGMDAPDFASQGNQPPKETYTSPFGGGTSPFGASTSIVGGPGSQPFNSSPGSPFGTPVNSTNSGVSLSHTPAGSFSPTGQSQPAPASTTGLGSMTDMPKASGIASDAISARIAALNRKLEEQTKSPGASGTVSAMAPTGQSLAPQPEYAPPSAVPPPAPPAPEFVPNPIVDDSPQTRAELVNRILGSAKISQTHLPDLPQRNIPDMSAVDQAVSQMHLPKGQKSPPKSKARARGGRPGINPVVVFLVIIVVGLACFGGYMVLKEGHIKGFDLNTISNKIKTVESKVTVEQAIKSGDFDKAIEMLEAKKESGKFSSAEGEKLYGLYYQKADKAFNNDDNPAEAIQLLEKIPKKTKKFKDAQKLLRKLKKKAEKN